MFPKHQSCSFHSTDTSGPVDSLASSPCTLTIAARWKPVNSHSFLNINPVLFTDTSGPVDSLASSPCTLTLAARWKRKMELESETSEDEDEYFFGDINRLR